MKQHHLFSIGAFLLVLTLSGLMTGCMEKTYTTRLMEKILFLIRMNTLVLKCVVM